MPGNRGRGLFWPGVLVGIGVIQLVERHRTTPTTRLALAGILLGVGGFNLYDGTIQHKLLSLHQVRAGTPNNLPTPSPAPSSSTAPTSPVPKRSP
jgi:uncharacterized membrane protein